MAAACFTSLAVLCSLSVSFFSDREHNKLLQLTVLCSQRSSFLRGMLQQLSSLCVVLFVQPLHSLVAHHVSGGSLVGGAVAVIAHIKVEITKDAFSEQVGEGTAV